MTWAGMALKDHLVPTPNNQQSHVMLSIKYNGKGKKMKPKHKTTQASKPHISMPLFLKSEPLQLILEIKGADAALHLFKTRLIKDRRTSLMSALFSNPKDHPLPKCCRKLTSVLVFETLDKHSGNLTQMS